MAPGRDSKRKRALQDALPGPSTPGSNKKMKSDEPDFSAPSEMLTFRVGKHGKDEIFMVHKEFACHHSPALADAFSTRRHKPYRLRDISPGTFRLFVKWLYTRTIPAPPEDVDSDDHVVIKDDDDTDNIQEADRTSTDLDTSSVAREPISNDGVRSREPMLQYDTVEEYYAKRDSKALDYFYLIQLWILAGRLRVARLQNVVMKHLYDFHTNACYSSLYPYVYEQTVSGSVLRQRIVDRCIFTALCGTFSQSPQNYPKQLLIDIANTAVNAIRSEAHNEADLVCMGPPGSYTCMRWWIDYLVPENE
ncbi:uncharacterized protein RSE6_01824 [Rhynchosporium secalis]|uniref:BTB domain-containing protein n=1 Tax=Rhynchosporium secalis TaxID=38038 RepID=A0A1E1LYT1_RHYSE|nr:uncharacterized protein RSE6_01824 [Rhynchosporium secalis]